MSQSQETVVVAPVAAPSAVVATDEQLGLLGQCRKALIKSAKGTGQTIKGYADALTAVFAIKELQTEPNGQEPARVLVPWFELKGKDKAPIKEERERFVADFEKAGFSKATIDVYWQRVKEASGYVTAGNRVKGSTDVDARTVEELRTIINRIFKAEEDGQEPKASAHKRALMDVYESLGGDTDKLG